MPPPNLQKLWEESIEIEFQIQEEKGHRKLASEGQRLSPEPENLARYAEIKRAALEKKKAIHEAERAVQEKVYTVLASLLKGRKLLDLFSGVALVPLALHHKRRLDQLTLIDSGEKDAADVLNGLLASHPRPGVLIGRGVFPAADFQPLFKRNPEISVINSGLALPPDLRRPRMADLTASQKDDPHVYRARHIETKPSSPIHTWSGVLTGLRDCKPHTVVHAFDIPYELPSPGAIENYVAGETRKAQGAWVLTNKEVLDADGPLWHFVFQKLK